MQTRERLREVIVNALSRWNVPSAGYGVIKDGEVLLCEGFGSRDIERGLPADGRTMYQIASCTKAFTAAVAARLVDEGRLDWDTPVRRYLPDLRFYDDETTENVTLRDLLCHRTGMPRHEWSWYRTAFTRDELIRNLRHLRPNFPFRSEWQYFNQGYMVAGAVIESVSGMTLHECFREYIFRPLGMSSTAVGTAAVTGSAHGAVPYGNADPYDFAGDVTPVDIYISRAEAEGRADCDPLIGAGEICSDAEDMLKWIRFHLDMGKAAGRQLISRQNMCEMHTAQIIRHDPVKDGRPVPEPDADAAADPGYGLGWFTDCYRGHEHIHHGGNLDGFSSLVSLVPDLDLGFVLLVNRTCFEGRYDVEHRLIDAVLGIEDTDWTARYMADARRRSDELKSAVEEALRAGNEAADASCGSTCRDLPRPAEDYCGSYSAPGYEGIGIVLKDGRLVLEFAGYEFLPVHDRGNDFVINSVETDLEGRLPVNFREEDGNITGLAIKLNFEQGTAPVEFTRD